MKLGSTQKNLGSDLTNILNVLGGKTAVQTSSAVSISGDTQMYLLMIALGVAAVVLSLKK